MSYVQLEQHSWQALRAGTNGLLSDADTALTTFEHANSQYEDNKWKMPKTANSAILAFWGTDAADEAGTMSLFGRGGGNGPIMEIWVGVVTLGSLVVTKNPITGMAATAYWGDTITSTGEEWVGDLALRNETADDKIGYLTLDLPGIKDLYLQFTTKTSVASIGGIILPTFRYLLST
jgi:hypothetical protein